ncbi:MAG TPA: UvrD-helicase domain-containing protein [Candidatus Binataceae bacterium]|nr:UvrD-helicase domain-containing protein [Candidatus Binataceae bacterium]
MRGAAWEAPAVDADKIVIDEEGRARLERALGSFDRAAIFTIHGFCQRVLTELAFLTGTRFDLEVVDAHRPFHQAFRAELRERLAERGGLLDAWLRQGGSIDDLEALLLEAHQRRYLESSSPRRQEELAERFLQSFDVAAVEREYRSICTTARQLNEAFRALKELNQRVTSSRGSGGTFLKALAEFNFKPLVRAKVSSGTPGVARFLRFAAELQLAAAIEAGTDEARETALVERYLPGVAERLERDKRERGQIDYEDMLLWVWRALESPDGTVLADTLRSRFRYGLADEFQDTDDLQWKILRRIFVEHNGGSRLFVVGDPKQAIYAFRGADVHTYLRACRELRDAGARRVPLVTNFRSTGKLVDALNRIFDQKAVVPFFSGDISYSDPAECGRRGLVAIDSSGNPVTPVVLMRCPERDDKSERASAAEAREVIGRHIAAAVREMLHGQNGLGIDEPDAEGKAKSRRVEARDIFVLTRTRRESEEIGLYLRESGVPFAFYKLEGLFQTREASDVLDVLKAIEEPGDRSRRLRAWSSRFFGVRYRDLATLGDVPESHPLNERLFEWSDMAAEERFAELFDGLVHESGLAERELWFSRGERELTNFLHIFEVLLERAVSGRLALAELIELLEGYIKKREQPPGPDGNVQRLEGEREAVQVMTVHMSKGLEADVVVLFGGSHRSYQRNRLAIYHRDDERRIVIGKEIQNPVRDEIEREEAEENERLLYVALTRARAQVYLPFFPDGSTRSAVNGSYKPLNERLKDMVASFGNKSNSATELFRIEDVGDSPPITANAASISIGEWSPPPELLNDDSEPETAFARARRNHAALSMNSYTSLKHAERAAAWSIAPEDFKTDLEAEAPATDLPGGSQVGIFLHDVIERLLELDTFGEDPKFESWQDRDDVKRLFRDSMRLHQVREPRWFDRGRQIVFNALTTRLAVGESCFVGPLHRCRSVREMEFVFPVPAQTHPGFGGSGGGRWTVERGFLKGFVDLVFEQDGLVYFADWKSDLLSLYEEAVIEKHVKDNYDLQARIYLVGVLRLLRIRSESGYAKRFGGLVFVFLRGVGSDRDCGQGTYLYRPSWSEVCRLESELMSLPQLS